MDNRDRDRVQPVVLLFGPWSNIKSIKLNMYHKECHALLDLMVKSGYKVQCYYKEPKKRKEAKNVRK